jgi:hypothetical protein
MLKAYSHIAAVSLAALAATAAQPTHLEPLSASQKQAFVAAVLATDQLHMEQQLPRKLARLHAFQPYFDMYELASTAYSLVLESPRDTSRWRALAKIAAWADGEYALPYAAARRKALDQNPHLFSFCPEFQKWVDAAQRGQNI